MPAGEGGHDRDIPGVNPALGWSQNAFDDAFFDMFPEARDGLSFREPGESLAPFRQIGPELPIDDNASRARSVAQSCEGSSASIHDTDMLRRIIRGLKRL